MGVLPCNRLGCENIMCDRYNTDLGYICSECFEELKNSGEHPALFMKRRKFLNMYDYEMIFVSRHE